MNYFLGPERPRVALSSWDEICRLAEQQLLTENQWCELKLRHNIKDKPTKEANLELARDLASLSVHGGVLIYGVADSQVVKGCDADEIAALRARISDVAQTLVDPPLSPVLSKNLSNDDGTCHVLVVHLPASASAPHMVDGSYYSRSSIGKRVLTDAEVRQHLERRASPAEVFRQALQEFSREDPLRGRLENAADNPGRAYWLAKPAGAMLVPEDVQPIDLRLLFPEVRRTTPQLRRCHDVGNSPDGISWVSASRPLPKRDEWFLLQVCMLDDAKGLSLVSGSARFVDERGGVFTTPGLLHLQCMEFLQLVSAFSSHVGYSGQWHVGVHIKGLEGVTIAPESSRSMRLTPFPRDFYTRTQVLQPATWNDTGLDLQAATMDLMQGYRRGLNLAQMNFGDITSMH